MLLYSHIGHMNIVFLHEFILRACLDLTLLLIYIHIYDMSIVFLRELICYDNKDRFNLHIVYHIS